MTADPNPAPCVSSRSKFWKTILFVAGSATFGGVAFALWNRRELASIQAEVSNPAPEEAPAYDEEEVFY